MNIDKHFVSQLTEIGLLAIGQGLHKKADQIVQALKIVRPESGLPYVISAFSLLARRQNTEAIHLLQEKALVSDPDNGLVKAVLGMALKEHGLGQQSEKMLTEALGSEDKEARALAAALLQ